MGRVVRSLVCGIVTVLALAGAVRLVAPADSASSVRRQLTFLRSELDSGAAVSAQSSFPEGYFFLYALYGLSWVDVGLDSTDRSVPLREARWALAHLTSPAGQAPFAPSLVPSFGVFYRGWVNWLRGGIVLLHPSAPERAQFQRDSAEIAAAFDDSPTLARPLGLGPAIREYPHGTSGPADVDSGPLPLGVSLSATVVALGAARVQGDSSLAAGLANFGEVAGLPLDTPHTRRYAFGLVPIGDAFLAWSKSARPWVAAAPTGLPGAISWWWRLPLLAGFVIVGSAPWLVVAARRRRRSRSAVTA